MHIRLYQTYEKEGNRREPTISDPMAIDKFIPYVHTVFTDSCNCGNTDTLIELSEITREWLDTLTDESVMLIGAADDEWFLRIHIYNVEIPASETTDLGSDK